MPYIKSIQPKADYTLKILFENGHTVILDMNQKIETTRFRQLLDQTLFLGATTDGSSIRWSDLIEISAEEIFEIAKHSR
ncbi:hypothetical protein SDC9_108687 [bioreactor metagenome]|uniref:DUF2442 domain-containing protein n=1 Tax=bioreactor metagenome TaxID=1076179 RepID=A0A645BJA7_9ZZZZ